MLSREKHLVEANDNLPTSKLHHEANKALNHFVFCRLTCNNHIIMRLASVIGDVNCTHKNTPGMNMNMQEYYLV